MGRKVSVVLDLDAAKYLREARAVGVETKVVDEEMKGLGRAADAVGRDMDELAAQTELAKKGVDGLGDEARGSATDLSLLQARIDATKLSLKNMNAEWAKTGDDEIRANIRKEVALLRDLERAAKEITFEVPIEDTRSLNQELERTRALVRGLQAQVGGDVSLLGDLKRAKADLKELEKAAKEVREIGQDFSLNALMRGRSPLLRMLGKDNWSIGTPKLGDLGGLKGMLIPGLVGLAAAAAPAIGAVVSGAVVGAVGAGGIIGGVVAASSDPRVSKAWRDFASGISPDSFARQAFVEPTVKGIGEIKAAFADLHIDEALGKGADAVPILARGIGDLARNFMPGFNAVMNDSTGIANIFADGLANVGDATSDMLTDLMKSPGTLEGLQLLFLATGDAIRFTGGTLGFLGDAFDSTTRFAAALSGAMEDLYVWLPPAHDLLAGINDRAEALTGSGGAVAGTIHHISDETMVANGQMDLFTFYLHQSQRHVQELNDTLHAWSKALDDVISSNLSVDEAQVRANQGMREFSETVKRNGRHWEDNTKAGQANKQALYDQIGTLEQLRLKEIAAGGDVAEANKKYDAQVEALLAIASQAGLSGKELARIAGTYEIKLILTAVIPAIQGATKLATDAFKKIFDFGGGRAAGGPVKAGWSYLVNENTPQSEIFTPTQDGYITPPSAWAAQSGGDWKAAAPMAGGGGGRVDLMVVVKDTSGRTLRKELITDALNRNQDSTVVAAAYP